MDSFYNNTINALKIDKIYSNYTEMMEKCATDGILVGRHVLVSYRWPDGEKFDNNAVADAEHGTSENSTVWQKMYDAVDGTFYYYKVACLDTNMPSFEFVSVEPGAGGTEGAYFEFTDDQTYKLCIPEAWRWSIGIVDVNAAGMNKATRNHVDESDKIVVEDISTYGDPNINDTKRLNFYLSSLGNAVSDMWDLVYGKDRKLDVDWINQSFAGAQETLDDEVSTTDLSTLAGTINRAHEIMGMIIHEDETDITALSAGSADPNRIYQYKDSFYRVGTTSKLSDIAAEQIKGSADGMPVSNGFKEVEFFSNQKGIFRKTTEGYFEINPEEEYNPKTKYYTLVANNKKMESPKGNYYSQVSEDGELLVFNQWQQDRRVNGIDLYELTTTTKEGIRKICGNLSVINDDTDKVNILHEVLYAPNKYYYKDAARGEAVFIKDPAETFTPGRQYYYIRPINDDAEIVLDNCKVNIVRNYNDDNIIILEQKMENGVYVLQQIDAATYNPDKIYWVITNGIENHVIPLPPWWTTSCYIKGSKNGKVTYLRDDNYSPKSGQEYYRITENIYNTHLVPYEKDMYYRSQDISTVLTDETRPQDVTTAYMKIDQFYVVESNVDEIEVGTIWNNEVPVPDGITIAPIITVYDWIELEGFHENESTLYGLLLRLDKFLNTQDTYDRSNDTLQGLKNNLQDLLSTFGSVKPKQFVVTNKYGKIVSTGEIVKSPENTPIITAEIGENDKEEPIIVLTVQVDATAAADNEVVSGLSDTSSGLSVAKKNLGDVLISGYTAPTDDKTDVKNGDSLNDALKKLAAQASKGGVTLQADIKPADNTFITGVTVVDGKLNFTARKLTHDDIAGLLTYDDIKDWEVPNAGNRTIDQLFQALNALGTFTI